MGVPSRFLPVLAVMVAAGQFLISGCSGAGSASAVKDLATVDSEGDKAQAPDVSGDACSLVCSGKECGDDGCGGSCGVCPSGLDCAQGLCEGKGTAIGPSGGAVTSENGAFVLSLPPQSLEKEVEFFVVEAAETLPGAVGKSWLVGPSGTKFLLPVQVFLKLNAEEAAGQKAGEVLLGTWDPGKKEWVPLLDQSLEAETLVLEGSIGHLSIVGLFQVSNQFLQKCLAGAAAPADPGACPLLTFPSGQTVQTYPDAEATADYQALLTGATATDKSCFTAPACFIDLCRLVKNGTSAGGGISLGNGYYLDNLKLSKNFRLWEFVRYSAAFGSLALLDPKLVEALQALGDELDRPITVSSGYRSPAHQKSVCQSVCNAESCGACAKFSQHIWGRGADLQVSEGSIYCILVHAAAESGASYCLAEWTGVNPHLHFDTRPASCPSAGTCPNKTAVGTQPGTSSIVCKGCCSEELKCLPGNTDPACGYKAELCKECEEDEDCLPGDVQDSNLCKKVSVCGNGICEDDGERCHCGEDCCKELIPAGCEDCNPFDCPGELQYLMSMCYSAACNTNICSAPVCTCGDKTCRPEGMLIWDCDKN